MPIDATIPLGIKTPDTMSTLGGFLSVAKGAQELRTGAIQQQRMGVQLEQEKGALDARKALATILADPEIRDPETGLTDLNKFYSKALDVDPNNYIATEVGGKIAAANADMIKVKTLGMALGDQAQAVVGQRLMALSNDPNTTKETVNSTLDDLTKLSPGAKGAIDIVRKNVNLLDDPRTLSPVLKRMVQFGFPLAAQGPQVAPVQTGAATTFAQTNPMAGQVGPMAGAQPVPNAVGPAGAETPSTDVLGNPIIVAKDAAGKVTLKAMPNASIPPLAAFPPGESAQTAQQLGTIRGAVNQAAAQVPEQHFNNHQIIKLADASFVGTGSTGAAKAMSALGMQFVPDNPAANYQQLGHFMALQSQNNAKAMGAGTDSARAISEQATGSTAWTPEAIKRATRVNDALATGVNFFNRGMEAALKHPENDKSIFAVRDFQNAWSQNFDVNAMRLFNALQAGDKNEQSHVIDAVGGKNSPGAKALAQKMRTLDSLATQGRP